MTPLKNHLRAIPNIATCKVIELRDTDELRAYLSPTMKAFFATRWWPALQGLGWIAFMLYGVWAFHIRHL